MKITKKSIGLFMAFLTAFSVAGSGCGPDTPPSSPTDLTISFWKAGWGEEYMINMVADFKAAYPEYNVDLQSSTDGFVFADTIDLDEEMNPIDLYIGSFMQTPYNERTEPLNDLLTEKCYGENITLGDKIGATMVDGLKHRDGKVFGIPEASSGYVGLVYNADIIGEGTDYEIPVTTDELLAIMEAETEKEKKVNKDGIGYLSDRLQCH